MLICNAILACLSLFAAACGQVVDNAAAEEGLQDIDLAAFVTYTNGYLRAEYTDVSVEPKKFVQADVLAIGVCYQVHDNDHRRKLTSAQAADAQDPQLASDASKEKPEPNGHPKEHPGRKPTHQPTPSRGTRTREPTPHRGGRTRRPTYRPTPSRDVRTRRPTYRPTPNRGARTRRPTPKNEKHPTYRPTPMRGVRTRRPTYKPTHRPTPHAGSRTRRPTPKKDVRTRQPSRRPTYKPTHRPTPHADSRTRRPTPKKDARTRQPSRRPTYKPTRRPTPHADSRTRRPTPKNEEHPTDRPSWSHNPTPRGGTKTRRPTPRDVIRTNRPTHGDGHGGGPYRKLDKVEVNKGDNRITLYYVDYEDFGCTDEEDDFTLDTQVKFDVHTDHDVTLRVKWKHADELSAATRLPDNEHGYLIRYYGADDSCSADAYKYLVATDQCSNFPDFFGRVTCKDNGDKLTYIEYPFDADLQCSGSGDKFKKQPFECSNQGTSGNPNYQEVECAN